VAAGEVLRLRLTLPACGRRKISLFAFPDVDVFASIKDTPPDSSPTVAATGLYRGRRLFHLPNQLDHGRECSLSSMVT
jgi:hypothetical protein